MKKLVYLTLILLISYFIFQQWQQKNPPEKGPTVTIDETTYTIEIADTPFLQQQGLSNHQSLASGTGMLFIFPQKYKHGFWMKDMDFPIDIIWILDDHIVDISENLPYVQVNPLPIYEPKEPVNYVLEVNAGEADKHNFAIGDQVQITLSP